MWIVCVHVHVQCAWTQIVIVMPFPVIFGLHETEQEMQTQRYGIMEAERWMTKIECNNDSLRLCQSALVVVVVVLVDGGNNHGWMVASNPRCNTLSNVCDLRQTTCTLNAYGLVQQLHVDSPKMCVYVYEETVCSRLLLLVFFFQTFYLHRYDASKRTRTLALLCLVAIHVLLLLLLLVFLFVKSISIVFSIETRFYEIVSIQFGRMRFSSVFNRFFSSRYFVVCLHSHLNLLFLIFYRFRHENNFFCSHIHASETKAISTAVETMQWNSKSTVEKIE